MYQIEALQQALAALEEHVEGLLVTVEFTGESEATALGNVPTVDYSVEMQGQEIQPKMPLPVLIAPQTLAGDIRGLLVDVQDPEVEALLQIVENCPVTTT